ncbi:hypothetical protein [Aquibacillus saliphilus]|uniref:hypothetical protein n=1 Tax=Aquibacillus saliphilus TaxID=1909422 RepID=UPI001CF0CC33|nr:hypothetical protein [Aquibacillus saliphilus]
MLNYSKWITIIFLIFVLIGCTSKEEDNFKGESEHWKGYLDVPIKNAHPFQDLVITYKGELEELKSVQQLIYSYDFGNYSGESAISFNGKSPSEKSFTAVISEKEIKRDGVIEVTVQWSGQEETFELKN